MLRPTYIASEEEATNLPVRRNQLIHGNRNSFNSLPKLCTAIWGTWPIFVTQQILFPTLLGAQSHPVMDGWKELTALSAWKCSVPEGRIWLDLNNDICNVLTDRTQKTPTGADAYPACREVFVNPPHCLSISSPAFGKSALGRLRENLELLQEQGGGSVCLGGPDRTLSITTLLPKSPGDCLSPVQYRQMCFCLLSSMWKPCFSYHPQKSKFQRFH